MEFVISAVTTVDKAGVTALMVEAFKELYDSGYGPERLPYYYKDEVITASWAGAVVGLIVFRHEEKDAALSVMLSYTVPAYRREGAFKQLWASLIKVAQEKKAVRVWGATHVDNVKMRAAYAALGRKETFVNSNYVIPPEVAS